MATTDASKKTHQCVLPQRAALESLSADTVRVTTKRGREATFTGNGGVAAGVDHGRGEIEREHRRRVRHHAPKVLAGGVATGGSDPATHITEQANSVHAKVFVLDRHGKPLMPCHPARARQLRANGRARVATLYPFTIRLIDRTVEDSEVDGVAVKIDPGSKATGIAVTRTTTEGVTHGLVAVEVRHRGAQIS